MKTFNFLITLISSVFILFYVVGCVGNPNRKTNVISTTVKLNNVSPSPTTKIINTLNPLPSLTIPLTPTLYFSPTIISSSTPTSLPSLTPLPTSSNPQAIIDRLYETNGDCKLPCWWGIIPGKTTLEQFRQFFEYLSINIENVSDLTFSVAVFSPGRIREALAFSMIKTKNDIVQEIQITSDMAAWGGFIPSIVLREYGQPDTIYYSPNHPHIFLFYQQQHFLAVYQLTNWKIGNGTSLCFLGISDIYTWSEEETWSKERISAKYDVGVLETYSETADPQFEAYYARLMTGDDYLCSQIK